MEMGSVVFKRDHQLRRTVEHHQVPGGAVDDNVVANTISQHRRCDFDSDELRCRRQRGRGNGFRTNRNGVKKISPAGDWEGGDQMVWAHHGGLSIMGIR